MQNTYGFDFGTTNTLISRVKQNGLEVEDLLQNAALPYPSILRYEGSRIYIGKDAKDGLSSRDLGVSNNGNVVRSPKSILQNSEVNVGGELRSPIDIASELISFVANSTKDEYRIPQISEVVATIPVNKDATFRESLRSAFGKAGINIVQFVPEPFAALYGYFCNSKNSQDEISKFVNRNVLVVDWGGGTLDITLCRVSKTQISSIDTDGTNENGGDKFDQILCDFVIKKFVNENPELANLQIDEGAKATLLEQCELNKIYFSSNKGKASFYVENLFVESEKVLDSKINFAEFQNLITPLVNMGIDLIDKLLERAGSLSNSVSYCLVVGGMSSMPSVMEALYEKFGIDRCIRPAHASTLVSQGAAWLAHNKVPLSLAKPIEIAAARGDYLKIIDEGTALPTLGSSPLPVTLDLFCTDPSDGKAKLSIVSPRNFLEKSSKYRSSLATLNVAVNKNLDPFCERVKVSSTIDINWVLNVDVKSSDAKDSDSCQIYSLELACDLPFTISQDGPDEENKVGEKFEQNNGINPDQGLLAIRDNVSASEDRSLIPGDSLQKYFPASFGRFPLRPDGRPDPKEATSIQRRERKQLEPCDKCGKSWLDPLCCVA